MKRRWFGALIGLAAVAACSDDAVKDRFAGMVVYDDFPASAKGEDRSEDLGITAAFVLSAGFSGGQAYQFLELGEFSPMVPKMYVLVRDGEPVAGQYPIIDTLPDKDDYSPWWQVVEVEVPADYVANDIKSKSALDKSGYVQTATLEAVHCPVVNPDAMWVSADLAEVYNVFWGTGEPIPNPYFDPSSPISEDNPAVLNDEDAGPNDILLTPVWHKRLRAFCWSEDFSARQPVVEEDGVAYLDTDALPARIDAYVLEFGVGGEYEPMPAATFPVFEAAPGEDGYSAAVVEYASIVAAPDQAGSLDDFDLDGLIPLTVVDNPIVFPLYVDRFQVTVANTTAEADGIALGAGAATVSDGDGALFYEDDFATTALAALAFDGDASGLWSGWPVTARFYDVILDARRFSGAAAGESASVIVVAHPYFPYLSVAQAVSGFDDAFTGVSLLPLYDDDYAPIDAQTEDLYVFNSNYDVEDGVVALYEDDNADPPEVVVGTVTTTLLTGGAQ